MNQLGREGQIITSKQEITAHPLPWELSISSQCQFNIIIFIVTIDDNFIHYIMITIVQVSCLGAWDDCIGCSFSS